MVRSEKMVGRANILVFVAMAIALAAFGAVVHGLFSAAVGARVLSQHSYEVIGAIKDLDLALRNAETGQRGYLLTGKDDYLAPYESALGRVGILEGQLQSLTADDPEFQGKLRELLPQIQRKLEELGQTVELRRTVGADAAFREVNTDLGRNYMRQIEAGLNDMLTRQQTLLATRLGTLYGRAELVRSACYGAIFLAALALLGAALLLNMAWNRAAVLMREQHSLALRLRTSLDSISQGIGVFDASLRLTDWNHCFQVLLDLPRAMLRTGTPYAAFAEHTGTEAAPLLETETQIAESLRAGSDSVSYERITPDRHHLELRRTKMPDGGFVLTISDMSKRAEAEAVMREAQKMQAIGQLTGGIAHDFNNLLTVILGNLEFARAKLTPDQAGLGVRLERAVWAAQRGATLTSQLLAFARRQPLAPSAISLSATIPQLIPLLRRTLGEHIEVRFVDAAGLWPAMADPAQLESAVLNLALNARDAMPGGGRLTIELANKVLDPDYARAHAEVAAGDYTMVAVSDTGHGMTPEVMARVFEPFFTTKPDGKGTGLGLAMVFGFVKQSGGHVKIYSEPNEGTTVRMYLPRALGPVAALPRLDRVAQVPRGTATVLVVEDEAAVREIAVAILRDHGYDVLEAADAEEALRVFGDRSARVDLLLTDVVLPGRLRGRELADRIVAVRPQVKVLFMSGYTENAIVHHGRLDDGVHLISKPFKREQLAQKVAEVLGMDGASAPSNVVGLHDRRET
jgi:signal transduction histidine kinase/CheY-like chemotaxis protein